MSFQSILYADTSPEMVQKAPAFFQDLQLDYLLNLIEHSVKGYVIRPYYYTLPGSKSLIQYRQQVCKDLLDEALNSCVRQFCFQLQKSRRSHELSLQCEEAIQKASYHLEAASLYWNSLLTFEKGLASCTPSSDGIIALREYVKKHIAECRERGFDQAVERAENFFSQVRFRLTIEQDRITITEETESAGDYLQELSDILRFEDETMENSLSGIFPNALEPSYLETTLIKILKKSNPGIFDAIRNFHQTFPDFYSNELLCFEKEVQFYLSFLEFKGKTEALGYPLHTPRISAENEFSGAGVYDLALVWKNANRNYTVIANDFCWRKTPSFFVVTGPNQGGKTTFARSMGQAVYLAMMGLYTNASALILPYFNGILTHFEAEEQIQSNSGKLKEEINRLAPMMQQENKNQFVILNELFTTATTYDALIMGKKVMAHFLQKDCYGIYVTHIQELAEETDSIISLVAQVEVGEDQKRTYRMMPMKAQGYGYSDSLVKQFRLTYEELIRRLS